MARQLHPLLSWINFSVHIGFTLRHLAKNTRRQQRRILCSPVKLPVILPVVSYFQSRPADQPSRTGLAFFKAEG